MHGVPVPPSHVLCGVVSMHVDLAEHAISRTEECSEELLLYSSSLVHPGQQISHIAHHIASLNRGKHRVSNCKHEHSQQLLLAAHQLGCSDEQAPADPVQQGCVDGDRGAQGRFRLMLRKKQSVCECSFLYSHHAGEGCGL